MITFNLIDGTKHEVAYDPGRNVPISVPVGTVTVTLREIPVQDPPTGYRGA